MRSKISTLLLSLFACFAMQAQEAEITFKIKNAGVFVDGSFDSIQVVQDFDPENLNESSFQAKIPVSTIFTGIKSRDRHLLKAKYFNVEEYPEITFNSTDILKVDEGYELTGDLTIKGITKSIKFDFKLEEGGLSTYYSGYLELDRRDYGVGKNHLILGDLVRITIQVPVESQGI